LIDAPTHKIVYLYSKYIRGRPSFSQEYRQYSFSDLRQITPCIITISDYATIFAPNKIYTSYYIKYVLADYYYYYYYYSVYYSNYSNKNLSRKMARARPEASDR
jgi:hypothetical protein